jgi:hypothetical protein
MNEGSPAMELGRRFWASKYGTARPRVVSVGYLAVVGRVGRQRLQSRGIGPAEDVAGDSMRTGGGGQLWHERRQQRQGADEQTESESAAPDDARRSVRAARAPAAQGGGDANGDGERLPGDNLPMRPVEADGRGCQREGGGGKPLKLRRPAAA